MRKFKWISFILVLCILASTMVGCAGKADQKETGSTTVTPSKDDSKDETPVVSGL